MNLIIACQQYMFPIKLFWCCYVLFLLGEIYIASAYYCKFYVPLILRFVLFYSWKSRIYLITEYFISLNR